MEATYIKNKGVTETTIQDNHHHTTTNEIKWDADYNGKYANIKLDIVDDGKKNKYRIKLDNKDLANMLNIPSVNRPIDQRLEMDFLEGQMEPEIHVDLQKIQTPKSFILPQLKPELEPEPILYRVNIPQIKNTMSLEKQLLDIDRELSELSSIMIDGNTELESQDIKSQIPIQIIQHSSPEFIHSKKHRKQSQPLLTHKVINPNSFDYVYGVPSENFGLRLRFPPISRKRKENKTKKLLYKTQLPKTIRIHYKTPRQNRTKFQKKKTIKRRKHPPESNKHVVYEGNRNGFTNFFRNLSK